MNLRHFYKKMTAPKTKRNTRSLKARHRFRISRKPLVDVAAYERVQDPESLGSPHADGLPRLFAIARDSYTIFASWNVDWQSVFEKIIPVDRQVYLRLYGEDDVEEQRVAVQPMAWTHYVTTSKLHGTYRVDIGYYEPADVWHSIAISNEVLMPRNKVAESVSVDLATIPFHLSFQQLLDSLRAESDGECANVISRFQEHALSKGKEELSSKQAKIFEQLQVSLPQIAKEWRDFHQVDCERLARRTGVLFNSQATSPSRGFDAAPSSAAS
jgi:hypothetical protein